MNPEKSTKEVIYKMHKIKSQFNNAVKTSPKRKSDDATYKSNLFLALKNTNSNAETTGESNNKISISKKNFPKSSSNMPKQKHICIKFKDLIVDSDKSDEDSDNHLELALILKKQRKFTNKKVKITKCNDINLNDNKNIEENKNNLKKCKSMGKVILGEEKEENIFIKKIRKTLFCC